jgi:hypothetical protein
MEEAMVVKLAAIALVAVVVVGLAILGERGLMALIDLIVRLLA